MTKILSSGRSNPRELSDGSIVDITTAVENEFLFFDSFLTIFPSFSRIFNLSQKIISSVSLPCKSPLIEFKILYSSGRFEKLSNFECCSINHVVNRFMVTSLEMSLAIM